MRETQNAQASIFEEYSNHEYGVRLRKLSEILDRHSGILDLVAAGLIDSSVLAVARIGLGAESVLRCFVLGQQLGFSFEQLDFHLSDSVTYQTLPGCRRTSYPVGHAYNPRFAASRPKRWNGRIKCFQGACWNASLDKLRIDSTVVASNIAPPSDSQLLDDTARFLPMMEGQTTIYGRPLRQIITDDGYANQENLAAANELGTKDVPSIKRRGLKVKSPWVYRYLMNFRAGIKGDSSCLKRAYGLSRYT